MSQLPPPVDISAMKQAMQQPDPADRDFFTAIDVPPDRTYEPHCLMAWAQMVAGMDETTRIPT